MGIRDFYKKILRGLFNDKLQVRSLPDGRADVVYIDGNATVHTSAGPAFYGKDEYEAKVISVKSEERKIMTLHETFLNLMQRIVDTLRPRVLVIAMDGIVPASKMRQQRERRYRSVLMKDMVAFDSNAITVGTPFMNAFDLWLRDTLKPGNAKLDLEEVIYVNHRASGEGEHLILELVRSGRIKDTGLPHVIFGLDADLFELGALMPVQNVFLARGERLEIFESIRIMMTLLQDMYNVDRYDLVVILKYLGNDHLPRMPAFEGMLVPFKRALEFHRDSKEHLTVPANPSPSIAGTPFASAEAKGGDVDGNSRTINWIAWRSLTTKLAREEAKFLAEPGVRNADIILDDDSYDAQYNRWYARALKPKAQVAEKIMRIPEIAKLYTVTRERIENMVRRYKTMLAWCCRYYFGGYIRVPDGISPDAGDLQFGEQPVPVSARWDVYYPYDFAPFLVDLASSEYVPTLESYCRFGDFSRWEVQQLLEGGVLPAYELRRINDWFTAATEAGTREGVLPEWFIVNGDTPRRILHDYLYPRRLITQLYSVIPPASVHVLDKTHAELINKAIALDYTRPIEYAIEASDIKELPSGQPTPAAAHALKTQLEQKERIVYLPDMDYVNIYKYFLRADVPRLPRTEVITEYRYSKADRYRATAGARGSFVGRVPPTPFQRPTQAASRRPSNLKMSYETMQKMREVE